MYLPIVYYSMFWKPKYKYELVNWLTNYYSDDKMKFNKMDKKQLYAIYYKVQRKKIWD